ncbi:hypothetical protein BH10PSE6_BH10PSE6_52190 [soil metagenome]
MRCLPVAVLALVSACTPAETSPSTPVRKDGYDLVVWSGPATPAGTQRINYRSTRSPATSHLQTSFGGFIYVVRGYRSNAGPPPEARLVGAMTDHANGVLARERS